MGPLRRIAKHLARLRKFLSIGGAFAICRGSWKTWLAKEAAMAAKKKAKATSEKKLKKVPLKPVKSLTVKNVHGAEGWI
jgi:uncharacterized protein (DUF2237 family)